MAKKKITTKRGKARKSGVQIFSDGTHYQKSAKKSRNPVRKTTAKKKAVKRASIKVGDTVSLDIGGGMSHVGKVTGIDIFNRGKVKVQGIGDTIEKSRLRKVVSRRTAVKKKPTAKRKTTTRKK